MDVVIVPQVHESQERPLGPDAALELMEKAHRHYRLHSFIILSMRLFGTRAMSKDENSSPLTYRLVEAGRKERTVP